MYADIFVQGIVNACLGGINFRGLCNIPCNISEIFQFLYKTGESIAKKETS